MVTKLILTKLYLVWGFCFFLCVFYCFTLPWCNGLGETGSRRSMLLKSIVLLSAERKFSLGKDWHGSCLKCERCNKTLTPGSHAEHEGKPYCHTPCYGTLFGPGGRRVYYTIRIW